MRAAILGWGSLVWDPRDLARHIVGIDQDGHAWRPGGPVLPIEFSRVSGATNQRYLSLVIDREYGAEIETLFATSSRDELDDTIADLRCREGTTLRNIGFVDLRSRLSRARDASCVPMLTAWARAKGFDAVVWTDLAPNFNEKVGKAFTPVDALAYLQSLRGDSLKRAREYMTRAPAQVETPVRRLAAKSGWLGAGVTSPRST